MRKFFHIFVTFAAVIVLLAVLTGAAGAAPTLPAPQAK